MSNTLVYGKTVNNRPDQPWLVLVHGFTQNHKIFNRQIEAFSERFNLLLMDLRGHGDSTHISGPYGIEEYTDDLERLIDHHKLESLYYWGTHTGTAIGLVYALRYPGRIRGMVLEGTVLPGFPMPKVAELIQRAREISADKGIEAAKEDWFDYAGWFSFMRQHPLECRAEEHRAIIREFDGTPWVSQLRPEEVSDVNQRLDEIDMPILMYNGEEDMDDFIRAAGQITEKKPEARSLTIPHAGGFPCWENPEEVNRVVGEFFTGLGIGK